jgi:hypothetical protein
MESSAPQLEPPSADVWTVRKVVQLGTNGLMRVPDFQRPFRWGAKDVRDLFDSILNGYPVGSLLLWQREGPKATVAFGPVEIDAPKSREALFMVDGQQRLTSLVAALAGGDSVLSTPFELYVDLDDDSVKSRGHRKSVPPHWLPLRLVLDTPVLLQHLRDLDEAVLDSGLSIRATDVASRIADFKVPVSVVRHDDEQVIREIFERVNATGKRLKGAEVFRALHAAVEGEKPYDLRTLATEIANLGFGRFSEDDALRCVLALRGGDVYRTNWQAEFADGTDPAGTYRETFVTVRRVIAFLRDEAAIPHRLALPYIAVLPVLVRFFALQPEPAPYTLHLLRRWVWRSIASWTGNRDPKPVRIAVRDLDDEGSRSAEGDQVLWLLDQLGTGRSGQPNLDAVRMNVAAARMNVALLGTLGPRDLVSGDEVDLASHLDQADPPSTVFASFAPEAGGDASGEPAGDQSVTAALAWRLLQPVLDNDDDSAALRQDDAIGAALMTADDDVLRSHGFDDAAIRGLRDGDLRSAAAARGRALATRLRDAWEQLAEPDAVNRPALESLTVDD